MDVVNLKIVDEHNQFEQKLMYSALSQRAESRMTDTKKCNTNFTLLNDLISK